MNLRRWSAACVTCVSAIAGINFDDCSNGKPDLTGMSGKGILMYLHSKEVHVIACPGTVQPTLSQ